MEKVSGIIPASTRQTWVTGEIAKPKRASEPTPEKISIDEISVSSRPVSQIPKPPDAEIVGKTNMAFKGGKLSRMA